MVCNVEKLEVLLWIESSQLHYWRLAFYLLSLARSCYSKKIAAQKCCQDGRRMKGLVLKDFTFTLWSKTLTTLGLSFYFLSLCVLDSERLSDSLSESLHRWPTGLWTQQEASWTSLFQIFTFTQTIWRAPTQESMSLQAKPWLHVFHSSNQQRESDLAKQ